MFFNNLVIFLAVNLTNGMPKLPKDVQCAQLCTYYYKPFCAAPNGDKESSDKLTFANDCILKVQNCLENTSKVFNVYQKNISILRFRIRITINEI